MICDGSLGLETRPFFFLSFFFRRFFSLEELSLLSGSELAEEPEAT